MSHRIVKVYTRRGVFSGRIKKYARVEVPNEKVTVKHYTFRINNYYDVPYKLVNDETQYVEPLENPDFNLKRQFSVYRDKAGLLQPEQIHELRTALCLNQTDVAFLFGMSVSNLSKIEKGDQIQSVGLDTRLRILLCPQMLKPLLKVRIRTVKVSDLSDKLKHELIADFKFVIKQFKRYTKPSQKKRKGSILK